MRQSPEPLAGKPLIVALDLSERSTACLAYGCEMAAKLGQPLILLHVVHETAETAGMYRRHHGFKDTTPVAVIAREMLEERIAEFRETCDGLEHVCEVRPVVVDGIPETRIAEVAERFGAGAIVMCSRNRHGLDRWLHGSVTQAVARRASCPVVAVESQEQGVPPLPKARREPAAVATIHHS
jgi:nucleotide-binding universal stress UspA family protein